MKSSHESFSPAQFAARAGVTVRTLHHYDRMGLLRPARRSAAGHRRYAPRDFVRLQQIVTLKFLGFSLPQIRSLLQRRRPNLSAALLAQRRVLEERRRRLDRAIEAIAGAERALAQRPEDWEAFRTAINTLNLQTEKGWMKQYYSEEAQKLIEARKHLWSPNLQKEVEAQWSSLISLTFATGGAKMRFYVGFRGPGPKSLHYGRAANRIHRSSLPWAVIRGGG